MGKVIIALGGGGGLDTDECTAGRPQVLSGYTAGVRGEDDPAPGTMPEKGAWTGSVAMNGSVTIPEGHHNGKGKVNGPAVTQRGAWTGRIGVNGKAVIPEGYHNGAGYVDQAITNRGTWNGSVAMNGSVTVPEGYHNGSGRVSGPSVTDRGAWGSTIGINGSVTIPAGYHNGSGKITQNIGTMGGQTVTPTKSQQTVSCSGKYMTGNVVVNAIPNNYFDITTGQTSFSYGVIASDGVFKDMKFINLTYNITPVYYNDAELQGDGTVKASHGIRMGRSLVAHNKTFNMTPFKNITVEIYNFSNERAQFNVYIRASDKKTTLASAYSWDTPVNHDTGGTLSVDVSSVNQQAFIMIKVSDNEGSFNPPASIFINQIIVS